METYEFNSGEGMIIVFAHGTHFVYDLREYERPDLFPDIEPEYSGTYDDCLSYVTRSFYADAEWCLF